MSITFRAKHKSGFTVDSPLKPMLFPDGAAHVSNGDYDGADDYVDNGQHDFDYQLADVRGFSNDDMFTLAMWGYAVDQREQPKVIILPYLPGARMDRGIPEGSMVYAWFLLNDINPTQIITLDPHSSRAADPYVRKDYREKGFTFTVFPVERIIRKVIQDAASDSKPNAEYVGVIAPDKGAHDRAKAAADVMGVPVYTGGKTRDFATGKLTGFHMEDELPTEGKLLIVDDICDGGGTFNGLAAATGLPKERLDLWVTHGIFSKGLSDLRKNFGVIHTTNSYYAEDENGHIAGTQFNADPDFVKVHDITAYLYGEIKP